MPGVFFRAVHLCACAASLLVIAGYHPRAAAAFLFLAAASTLRWNVLASYLDDAMMHVFCLWLVLLPVGHTLTLADLLAGRPATEAWLTATVPGLTPRVFLANMALVYLVAGIYKFTSPMWRDGSAMHAALRMPIARAPDFWTPRWRTPLRLVTWAALVMEPFFALIFVLPAGSALKWLLVAGAVVFHLGIAFTLKIPYSNAAMAGALPLAFGPEIMQMGLALPPPPRMPSPGLVLSETVALTLITLIVIMLVWEAANTGRRLRERYSASGWDNPVRALLWTVGIFQSYRLFDWVDARNYHLRFEVRQVAPPRPTSPAPEPEPLNAAPEYPATEPTPADSSTGHLLNPDAMFPQTMRHLLLQSYLVGNIWLRMSPDKLDAVRRSLLERHARRYARMHPGASTIDVAAIVQRVTADNLELTRGVRRPLMRFTCRGGDAVVHFPE